MARRRRIEENENHDRWLVSYADFITLLFAFFVMMYAISSVNEGKYRVLADSMVTAFKDSKSGSASTPESANNKQPIQIGKTPKTLAPVPENATAQVKQQQKIIKTPQSKAEKTSQQLHQAFSERLDKWVRRGQVNIRRTEQWVEIEISSGFLFKSGSAVLSPQAIAVLEPTGYELLGTDNPIYVFGHSDNFPINTLQFPSNWELSASRAVSVVKTFAEFGLEPERMAAIGYGETRPIADNNSLEGRRKNRRVVIRVYSGQDVFNDQADNKS